EVSLIRPPPPPVPVVKPPEPPKREEVKLPEPEVVPQHVDHKSAPPASERLGLDAAPGNGTDAFGLEANKGGRDITLGQGNGDGRSNTMWYVGVLQDQLNSELNKNQRLRASGYRAELQIWFTGGGTVEHIELIKGTGDAQIDEVLQTALKAMPPLRRPPPEG